MKVTTDRPKNVIVLNPRQSGPVPSSDILRTARRLAKKRKKVLVPAAERKAEMEMESTSDWNSLLLTARAQRGPQWDVLTQQYLVDHRSRLYYNYEPLIESTIPKEEKEEKRAGHSLGPPPQRPQHTQHHSHNSHLQPGVISLSQPQYQSYPQQHQMQQFQLMPPQQHQHQQQYVPQHNQQVQIPMHHQAPQQIQMSSRDPSYMNSMQQQQPQQLSFNMDGVNGGSMEQVYIPPEVLRNPRRTTRAQREGMYRM